MRTALRDADAEEEMPFRPTAVVVDERWGSPERRAVQAQGGTLADAVDVMGSDSD